MASSEGKKGDRYHHGQLRAALLDAALELAGERGLGGFSMREIARRAGVSHNAPYHHFADRAALVEELAAGSFAALAEELEGARARTGGDAVEKLLAVGEAYVRFAVNNPTRFRFMFRPELRTGYRAGLGRSGGADVEEGTPARRAASGAYRVLLASISECQRSGLVVPGDPAPLALAAWSTVHGLAVLVLDGPEDEMVGSAEESQEAAEAVTRALVFGLLVR